jgi:hypothetical protein
VVNNSIALRAISAGSGDNFVLTLTLRIVINAQGELTVDVLEYFTETCVG